MTQVYTMTQVILTSIENKEKIRSAPSRIWA